MRAFERAIFHQSISHQFIATNTFFFSLASTIWNVAVLNLFANVRVRWFNLNAFLFRITHFQCIHSQYSHRYDKYLNYFQSNIYCKCALLQNENMGPQQFRNISHTFAFSLSLTKAYKQISHSRSISSK